MGSYWEKTSLGRELDWRASADEYLTTNTISFITHFCKCTLNLQVHVHVHVKYTCTEFELHCRPCDMILNPGGVSSRGGREFLSGVGTSVGMLLELSPSGCCWIGRKAVLYTPPPGVIVKLYMYSIVNFRFTINL